MKQRKITLLIDILVLVLGIIGVYLHYLKYGLWMFQFYTLDSNLFATIAFGISVFYDFAAYKKGTEPPCWTRTLKYYSTCTVMVTFVVVVAVLSPMMTGTMSYGNALIMFLTEKEMLYHHLLVPVLCFISLCFVEPKLNEGKSLALKGTIFTLVYGAIAYALNGIGFLDGPYPFLKVHEQSIFMSIVWVIAIWSLAYGLAMLIYRLNGRKNNE